MQRKAFRLKVFLIRMSARARCSSAVRCPANVPALHRRHQSGFAAARVYLQNLPGLIRLPTGAVIFLKLLSVSTRSKITLQRIAEIFPGISLVWHHFLHHTYADRGLAWQLVFYSANKTGSLAVMAFSVRYCEISTSGFIPGPAYGTISGRKYFQR
jgi:hypothetical protein